MFKNLSNNELLMIVFLVALALYLYSNGDIVEGIPTKKKKWSWGLKKDVSKKKKKKM